MSCTTPTSAYASSTPSPNAARQIDDDAFLKREALRLVHGQRATRDNRKLFASLPRAFPDAHHDGQASGALRVGRTGLTDRTDGHYGRPLALRRFTVLRILLARCNQLPYLVHSIWSSMFRREVSFYRLILVSMIASLESIWP